MQCTHLLVCKCRTVLPIFQQSLAFPRFDSSSALNSCDAGRALRLACMEAFATPTCAGHTQAWSEGRLMSPLLQSSTTHEDRPHQFHLLHLCPVDDVSTQPWCARDICQKLHIHHGDKPKSLHNHQHIQP